jgi:hypothetical protein
VQHFGDFTESFTRLGFELDNETNQLTVVVLVFAIWEFGRINLCFKNQTTQLFSAVTILEADKTDEQYVGMPAARLNFEWLATVVLYEQRRTRCKTQLGFVGSNFYGDLAANSVWLA